MRTFLTALLTIITFSFPAFAETDIQIKLNFWMAFQSGQTAMTNYDIENYICDTTLTDEMMISLFKEANGDFGRYQLLRRKYAQNRFQDGLRQFSYVYSMQKAATNKLYNRDGRKAFKITERDFQKRVDEFETRTLKTWLDKRQGIVKAREAYGSELKKIGYPHQEGISNTDLYFEWFNLQKRRIKENLRLKELQKYEYLSALGYKREFYVRPVEIFDFKKELEGIIEDQLQGKRITGSELAEIFQKDQRLPVLIKGAELLSPDSTELSKLKKLAIDVYNDFESNIREEVISKLDNKLSQDILRYDSIVETLVKKYNDQEKLEQLSNEMNQEFLMGSGDFNNFMMARLYDMAAIRVKQGSSFKANSRESQQLKVEYLENLMQTTNNILTNVLSDPETIGTARLEDHFIKELNNTQDKLLSEQLKSDEYLRQFRTMANWVVKFQIKKASLNTIPLCLVDIYDSREWEGQNRIEKYLSNKQYIDDLDQFRRNEMRRIGPFLTLNPNGESNLDYDQSWNFVLEKFKK